jgi:tetratricopeptide (TPR) repeat protein
LEQAGDRRRLAGCLEKSQRWHEALAIYQELDQPARVAKCMENLKQWANAAEQYNQLGQWVSAARCFKAAQQWRQAAECEQRAGNWGQAAEMLLKAQAPLEAAECFRKAGNSARAAGLYETMCNWRPAAECQAELRNWGKAAILFEAGEEWASAGHCLEKQGRQEQALALYERHGLWEELAGCNERFNQRFEAAAAYAKVGHWEDVRRMLLKAGYAGLAAEFAPLTANTATGRVARRVTWEHCTCQGSNPECYKCMGTGRVTVRGDTELVIGVPTNGRRHQRPQARATPKVLSCPYCPQLQNPEELLAHAASIHGDALERERAQFKKSAATTLSGGPTTGDRGGENWYQARRESNGRFRSAPTYEGDY